MNDTIYYINMRKKVLNYLIFILWYIILYYIGIFVKNNKFNLKESQLFLIIINIFSFFTSSPLLLCDNNPNETLKKLYNSGFKNIIFLFISCIPFYKLIILSYLTVDPIIIQVLSSSKLGINMILTLFINKKIFLCNFFMIISIIINLLSCYVILIFNNWLCQLHISNIIFNNSSNIGIIIIIISTILTSLTNVFNENIKNNITLNNDVYVYTTFIFLTSDILFSTIIYFILYITNDIINNIYILVFYATLFSLIYGPIYVLSTKIYLELNSTDIGLINNISFIIILLINYNSFCYLYIPFIFTIIISSLFIIYKYDKLSNNVIQESIDQITL